MPVFCTKYEAIDPQDGEIKTWFGPKILASDWNEAVEIAQKEYPHVRVHGALVSEMDAQTSEFNFLFKAD